MMCENDTCGQELIGDNVDWSACFREARRPQCLIYLTDEILRPDCRLSYRPTNGLCVNVVVRQRAPVAAVSANPAQSYITLQEKLDMDNDDKLIGRILSRREVLVLLGAAAGAAILDACAPQQATPAPAATAPAQ